MKRTSYEPGTPSWVDLGSPRPDEAAAFYRGLFGWEIPDPPPDTGGYRVCLLRGEAVAGLGPAQDAGGTPWWTTYITVDDCDATCEAVLANGGTVLMEPLDIPGVCRMAVCADPMGTQFSVWKSDGHVGAGLVNEPGTFTWNEVLSPDFERARSFYPAVFRWGIQEMELEGAPYVCWTVGEAMVGGLGPAAGQQAEVAGRWLTSFLVADCDTAVARVEELGGRVVQPAADVQGIGRFAVVADPDGAVFGVMHAPTG